MDPANVVWLVALAGAAIVVYFLVSRRLGLSKTWLVIRKERPASQAATQATRQVGGVRLCQVHPLENETETDVDIIAVHGLDTKSPDTWTWANPSDPKQPCINWLHDPDMLPNKVGRARIFTCDWPADIFETSNLVQKRFEELARLLRDGIRRRPLAANDHVRREDRPILFIASCLGGIILMKALVMPNDDYLPLRKATRGVVFLSTPFRGTSFQDVAKWAEPGLTACAWFRRKKVTKLLDSVKRSTFDLEELVRSFTQLCRDHRYLVFTFYEKGYTNLYRKHMKIANARQLVDEFSATLDIVSDPLPLDRRHVMMNKFYGPEDADYMVVAEKIEHFLQGTRKGTTLERADAWIRETHYTADRLKIERLSGKQLSMDRCYINLAILEQAARIADFSKEESEIGDTAPQPSPFSLHTRLKVETPDKKTQVNLPEIFNSREGPDGHVRHPRRILIRGRAGVGKTTLCKKIVYDFTNRGLWSKLFDRVLWVPLRTLKTWENKAYNLEKLFYHIFFLHCPGGKSLAEEMWCTWNMHAGRTLFILDGLDEVSQQWNSDAPRYNFLLDLLNQPNVIITSRPYGSLPPRMRPLDLELETIGFYPDQVKNYLEMAFSDSKKVVEVQRFLQHHRLVQGLVRIPIQLDALCYTWDDIGDKTTLQTMTAVYQAIEQRLWKKDVLRLEKKHDGELLTEEQIRTAGPLQIEEFVKDEVCFLENLAFTGLHNDIIEFESGDISKCFTTSRLLPDKTLPELSFLRTSDL
ncbi:hypothetical protein PENDEC_c030G02246 [Penicillium decumbens]|uniref:NACHT domain-containing protein n=1 Tax=Penicillium decumbens TaxID=69771 RepID=A0A1V6NVS9_PENDC|nr:hypothetical protein PENDEC_c030G02246 [Penicillium decumbens]